MKIKLKSIPKKEDSQTLNSGSDQKAPRTTPYEKWMQGNNKFSIRKSVNAKCYDCVCGERYSTRIKYCTMFMCPLWYVRPYRKNVTQEMCLAHREYGVIGPSATPVKKTHTLKRSIKKLPRKK